MVNRKIQKTSALNYRLLTIGLQAMVWLPISQMAMVRLPIAAAIAKAIDPLMLNLYKGGIRQ